jgi:hypothetical protein
VPERIKITVRASSAHPDVLTVQDAMRQVLDVFAMLESAPGVEWRLVKATTNSPLSIEGEAVSFEPSVDVSVVARAQKQNLARTLKEITHGKLPSDPEFPVNAAKRVLSRNLNGVGATEIDLEIGDPIRVTPKIAREAIEVLEKKPVALFDIPAAREEIGSIEGRLTNVGTYHDYPAIRVLEHRHKRQVWCRLTSELQHVFQDKASFEDVWRNRRIMVRGRLKYRDDGDIDHVIANDIRRIEPPEIALESIRDPDFTGGLSVAEYLDRFRDGTLG